MKIKTKIASLALAATLSFGVCAQAAAEAPKLLPFLYTDSAEVIAMIDSIEVADLTTEKQIEEAFLAYCDLEDSAKAEVTNYEKLQELRNEMAKIYNPDAESKQGGTLIDRSQILIGAYYYGVESIWNEKHFQEIKDCNLDMLLCAPNNTTLLDYCEKYGIGIVPYVSVAENFIDHPAIWGFDVVDEPQSTVFEDLEKTRAELAASFPDKLLYFNLFPSEQPCTSYGYELQSGKDFYDYIKDYEKTINTDFISYDLYQYSENQREKNGTASSFLAMGCVADVARESGKEFWLVPQVVSDIEDEFLSEQQLRYQVNTALAFGVRAINWACYTRGWWHYGNQPIDSSGNKTVAYDRLKTVNAEIKAISPIYMRYTNKDTAFTSAYDYEGQYQMDDLYTRHFDNDLEQKVLSDITATEKSTVLTGYFEKNIGEGYAFMFTNATDDYCGEVRPGGNAQDVQDVKITFKTVSSDMAVTAYYKDTAYKLNPDKNGIYSVSVPNGEGIFVTVEPSAE